MFDLSFDSANQLYGWSNVLLIIGAVAVLAGTIGVIWATGIRDRYADQRISKNEADTALANAEVAKATERTKLIEADTAIAQASSGKASAEAAKAIERTKTVEMELEKQRERTAKAEKELLLMEEGLKPRHLTLEQLTSLLKDLSSGEKGEIQIDFVSGNLEAENFALDIAKVLHATGWTVGKMGATTFLGKTPVGVSMIVRDPQTPRVSSLVSAFEHIGMSVPVKVNSKASHPVLLIVGHKP